VLLELRPKHSKPFIMEDELKRQYPEEKFVRPEGEAVYRLIPRNIVITPQSASLKLTTHSPTVTITNILLTKGLEHFVSKGALDIDGMGEKNVIALVGARFVRDLADIYTVTKEQLLELDRFAEISASKLVDAISAKKTPPLERFVYGLGIRHVGTQTAIDLVNAFGSLDALQHATIDDLKDVEGVGEVVAESVAAWFADEDNAELLKKFTDLDVRPYFEKKTGKLVGQNFVVTGTLESMGRDIAADKIRALGGTFQTSVAKDTNYLVAGANVGASKLKKAEGYGTKVINEQEFLKLLGES
jgi:DNA ligase (NAD+)